MTDDARKLGGGLSGPLILLSLLSVLLWPRDNSLPAAVASAPSRAGAQPAAHVPSIAPLSTATSAPAHTISRALAAVWGCEPLACSPRPELEIIHVSVPDPLDSRSGWLFDGSVDAIQRAIEATGKTLVRFELPWTAEGDSHRQRPGVLVFRGAQGSTLLVLLIGELPTTGLHREALRVGLTFEGAWRALTPDVPAPPIRLSMPAFSGSLESLGQTLEVVARAGELPSGVPIRVVSGSATSLPARPFDGRIGDHPIEVSATVRADALVLPSLISALDAYDWRLSGASEGPSRPPRVAVLVEANTGYGAQVARALEDAELAATILPFPLHISRLRNIYHRDAPADLRAAQETARLAPSSLRLSLSDDREFIDTPPSLSPELTARSTELVLASLLTTIYREEIRYLGIFATDTRDKLFLATQIRKYCPDVRLFTLEADILYSHPDYHAYLEGMLVASSYAPPGHTSLFATSATASAARALRRSSGPRALELPRRLEFSSTNVQGLYNAVLALLDAPEALFEGYLPDPSAPGRARPLLWISEVTRGGFWPRALLDPVARSASTPHAEVAIHSTQAASARALRAPSAPLSSSVFLWFFGLTLMVHCYAFWRPTSKVGAFLGFDLPGRTARLAIALVFVDFLVVGGELAMLWSIPEATREGTGRALRIGWTMLSTALFLGLGTALVALVDVVQRPDPQAPRGGRATAAVRAIFSGALRRMLLAMTLVVLAAAAFTHYLPDAMRVAFDVAWPREVGTIAGAEAIFFHRRATDLFSGLSPLVPVIFLATGLYLCCLYSLREQALLLDGRLRADSRALASLAAPGDALIAEGVAFEKGVLRAYSPSVLILMLVVFGALPVGFVYARYLPTWEGWAADVGFMVGAGLLVLALVLGMLRFLTHWRSAQRLFSALAAHPVGRAVEQLPAEMQQGTAALLSGSPLSAVAQAAERSAAAPFEALSPARDHSGLRDDARAVVAGSSRAPADDERTVAATRYLAISASAVVRRVVAHLGSDLAFLTGTYFCLLGTAFYPFQPRRLLYLVVTAFTVAGAAAVISVLLQIERNALVSRVTRGEPGKINWNAPLVLRLVTYGLLPLLALASAQIPELGRMFGLLREFITGAMP